jgi:NADH-quinone oxidoreductase subunit C
VTTQERFRRSSERVEPEEFSRRVSAKIGDLATGIEVKYGHIRATVEPSRIVDVATLLKTDPDLSCTYLTFLAGVDWEAEGFEVLVTLYSVVNENTVILSVPLPPANPTMPTLTGVFQSVNWHEREAHEMFGINFEGHPNLAKLYLPEDFVGHPLLKSFKLASRVYKPWPGAKDPSEAAGGGRA